MIDSTCSEFRNKFHPKWERVHGVPFTLTRKKPMETQFLIPFWPVFHKIAKEAPQFTKAFNWRWTDSSPSRQNSAHGRLNQDTPTSIPWCSKISSFAQPHFPWNPRLNLPRYHLHDSNASRHDAKLNGYWSQLREKKKRLDPNFSSCELIDGKLTTRSKAFFSVLKIHRIVLHDLFLLWTQHMRSIDILHVGRLLEVTMIFMLLIVAMRTQAVTQALDIRIEMAQGWMALKCSLANTNSKWRKLKFSQSLSKLQSQIILFAKPKQQRGQSWRFAWCRKSIPHHRIQNIDEKFNSEYKVCHTILSWPHRNEIREY
jgi:hypothetical protein